MAKRAEGDPPEAPKSLNPVCGKETMGNIMHQGMRRSQGGGEEGNMSTDRGLHSCPKGAKVANSRGACAYRLTSVDTRSKKRIVAPKALQNPVGYITDREGRLKRPRT